MKNVTEIVRFTSMPIIAEASLSWATARIALPCLVDRTNHVSTRSTGTTMRNTAIVFHPIAISPMVTASVRGMKFGTDSKSTP